MRVNQFDIPCSGLTPRDSYLHRSEIRGLR